MRARLLYCVAAVSLLFGVGNCVSRARALAPWSHWCRSEADEQAFIQRHTLRYGIDYREMSALLDRLPAGAGVWVETSDSVGAFPMSDYYAQMLQFYGAPRCFYAHPKKGKTFYHVIVRNSHPVSLKPWP